MDLKYRQKYSSISMARLEWPAIHFTHNVLTPENFNSLHVLHLGRFRRLHALLINSAHENMETCK